MRILPAWRAVADFALPPRCPGCGAIVGDDHRFCATCWSGLRFLTPPWCAGCGMPFAFDRGPDALCAECHSRPPRHAGVRAAVAYGPVARTVVLRLKYARRTAFAETIAALVARWMPTDADLVVPVPLHRSRLWSRGYNQAALIGEALAKRAGIACDRDALVRTRPTPVLRGLSGAGRVRAVAGAFAVPDRARVKGKRLVLVDDIHTSGATANACTAALLRAGALSVTVLCWARVLNGEVDD